jgi:hypothetical protein
VPVPQPPAQLVTNSLSIVDHNPIAATKARLMIE